MTNNTTILIEELYLKHGSYREAFEIFRISKGIEDPEDLLEVIGPILYDKIKQEFIDNKVFAKDSPHYKRPNLTEFFTE
jgi:hypothetical protein